MFDPKEGQGRNYAIEGGKKGRFHTIECTRSYQIEPGIGERHTEQIVKPRTLQIRIFVAGIAPHPS